MIPDCNSPRKAQDALASASTVIPAKRDVLAERQQQILAGFTAEHDDKHVGEELLDAARYCIDLGTRRDLVRAAALILAEIERLDRLAAASAEKAVAHG